MDAPETWWRASTRDAAPRPVTVTRRTEQSIWIVLFNHTACARIDTTTVKYFPTWEAALAQQQAWAEERVRWLERRYVQAKRERDDLKTWRPTGAERPVGTP